MRNIREPGFPMPIITQATGKQANILSETEEAHMSPFGVPQPWYMDTRKAEADGCSFQQLNEWLPKLIREIIKETSLL